MPVKKAIKILDWWILQKKNDIKKLENRRSDSRVDFDIEKTLLINSKTIISNLETIRNELVPNCDHPVNMQNRDPNGNQYCMNCNFDL